MNMNKLLAASLIAAVAMPVASADVCGNGGFYAGLNLGMAHQKVTAKAINAQSKSVDAATAETEYTKAKTEAENAKKAAEAKITDDLKKSYYKLTEMLNVDKILSSYGKVLGDGTGDTISDKDCVFDVDEEAVNEKYTEGNYSNDVAGAYLTALKSLMNMEGYSTVLNEEDKNELAKLGADVEALIAANNELTAAEATLNSLGNKDTWIDEYTKGHTTEVTPTLKAKKKWKFLAELNLGYDWRINDVMVGIDLNAGAIFGKNNIRYFDGEAEYAGNGSVKELWHVALMPRVGYLVTPQAEIYLTAGAKVAQFKTTTLKNNTKELISKKKVRFVPVVGAGLRYEITPEVFAKIEYNYEFKTKTAAHKDSAHSAAPKIQSHVVRLGVGYRF